MESKVDCKTLFQTSRAAVIMFHRLFLFCRSNPVTLAASAYSATFVFESYQRNKEARTTEERAARQATAQSTDNMPVVTV